MSFPAVNVCIIDSVFEHKCVFSHMGVVSVVFLASVKMNHDCENRK